MINLDNDFTLKVIHCDKCLEAFKCSDDDLTDFFVNDAIQDQNELMGKTYYFEHIESSLPACAFSLSNDILNSHTIPKPSRNKLNRKIRHSKTKLKHSPAVKIGRFGVHEDFARQGLGAEVMQFIKTLFTINNRTGCRFVIVDAYNSESAIQFYTKCDFSYLIPDEQEEKENFSVERGIDVESIDKLDTRMMYFDLKRLINSKS